MKKLSEKVSVPGRQAALARVAASIILAGCVLFAGSRLAVSVTPVEAAVSKTNAVPPERVLTVGNGVTAPVLTHSVDPEFPKNAGKPSGAGGVCVLNLVVGRDGRVMRVHVVRSIDAAFDRNAMAAVRQYRFDPALKEGNPVAVSVNIEVNFKRY